MRHVPHPPLRVTSPPHLAGALVVEVVVSQLDSPVPLVDYTLDREHPLFPGQRISVGAEDVALDGYGH